MNPNLNNFTSSGMLLMMLGAVLVYLKSLPVMLWDWLLIQTTMTLTVVDDDNSFNWVKEWFTVQPFSQNVRRVGMDSYIKKNGVAMTPAPGSHWFWYKGRPYRFTFARSEATKGWAPKRAEAFELRTIGRDRKVLESLLEDITQVHKKRMREDDVLYLWQDSYWERYPNYKSRTLDSVILRKGEVESIVKDISWFIGAESWYERLAIPYHRGYLWYGIPGTGKTSLISALAHNFKMPIYLISLADVDDRALLKAMMSVVQNSIVVLEDVDCMGMRKKAADKPTEIPGGPVSNEQVVNVFGVTLSGLLNILDGFKAPHGVMFMLTTNHVDKLDSALLRPGRVDFKMEFGKAKVEQRMELFKRFHPDKSDEEAIDFVMKNRATQTMADFQSVLMAEYETKKANGRYHLITEPLPIEMVN
jgi:chaperone BCS1